MQKRNHKARESGKKIIGKGNYSIIICLFSLIILSEVLIQGLRGKNTEKMGRQIYLVPIGEIEDRIVDSLKNPLKERFQCEVEIHEDMEISQDAYNHKRNQYSSTHILKKLRSFIKPGEQDKILGIANEDLYARGLNFVFGEAELGGRFAVISLARLHQSFYGLPENTNLFIERAVKEAVHELGHVYGLRHCPDSNCVMHFSNSLWDTDKKSSSFCIQCKKLLKKFWGNKN